MPTPGVPWKDARATPRYSSRQGLGKQEANQGLKTPLEPPSLYLHRGTPPSFPPTLQGVQLSATPAAPACPVAGPSSNSGRHGSGCHIWERDAPGSSWEGVETLKDRVQVPGPQEQGWLCELRLFLRLGFTHPWLCSRGIQDLPWRCPSSLWVLPFLPRELAAVPDLTRRAARSPRSAQVSPTSV